MDRQRVSRARPDRHANARYYLSSTTAVALGCPHSKIFALASNAPLRRYARLGDCSMQLLQSSSQESKRQSSRKFFRISNVCTLRNCARQPGVWVMMPSVFLYVNRTLSSGVVPLPARRAMTCAQHALTVFFTSGVFGGSKEDFTSGAPTCPTVPRNTDNAVVYKTATKLDPQ